MLVGIVFNTNLFMMSIVSIVFVLTFMCAEDSDDHRSVNGDATENNTFFGASKLTGGIRRKRNGTDTSFHLAL